MPTAIQVGGNPARSVRRAVVQHRVQQRLPREGQPAGIDRARGDRGREPAARRITRECDPRAVDTRMLGKPVQRRLTVVEGSRVGVLGGQAVADARDHRPERVSERAAQRVGPSWPTDDETATVNLHDRGEPAV